MQSMCLIYVFDLTKIEIRFVIWQSHCSAIVSPHLSVEELIEFFVNISRRNEWNGSDACSKYFQLKSLLVVWYSMEVSIDGEGTGLRVFLYQKLKEVLIRYSRSTLTALKDRLISKIWSVWLKNWTRHTHFNFLSINGRQ